MLACQKTTPFPTLKSQLLSALTAAKYTHINGAPLPKSPEDIEFAVPKDSNDLAKGWTKLEIDVPEEEEDDDVGAATGKGKKKIGGKDGVVNHSPAGAGLKDGSSVAFRFVGEGAGVEEWDVVLPSYEEEYASQLEGAQSQLQPQSLSQAEVKMGEEEEED